MKKLAGFQAWLWQRLSAVYLLFFSLFLLFKLRFAPPQNYQDWLQWIKQPQIWLGLSLFFSFLLIHIWVGLRDIVLDYIHPLFWRILVLSLILFSLISAAFWWIRLLVKL